MLPRRRAQQLEIERKSEELRRTNRTLRMLGEINSTIVRVRDRDKLFREACRIAVEDGGFKLAWIGVVDRDATKRSACRRAIGYCASSPGA